MTTLKQKLDRFSDRWLSPTVRAGGATIGVLLAAFAIAAAAADEGLSSFYGVDRRLPWDRVEDVASLALSFTLLAIAAPGRKSFYSAVMALVTGGAAIVMPSYWPTTWSVEVGGPQTVIVFASLAFQVVLGAEDLPAPGVASAAQGTPDEVRAVNIARRWIRNPMAWTLPVIFAAVFIIVMWAVFLLVQYRSYIWPAA